MNERLTLPKPSDNLRPDGTPWSVLFVDDDAMVCRSMGKCLDRVGFRTVIVMSAEEALARIGTERFDVVVTDHNMPGMSGTELIERLMERDPTLRGRVILTSGDLHSEANEALMVRTGAKRLQKPFQVAELALAVRAATARLSERPA